MRLLAAAAAAVITVACGRTPSPEISFVGKGTPTAIEVRGLPAHDQRLLSTPELSNEQWRDVLRVEVSGSSGTAVAGSYTVGSNAVRFTPMFGFDGGRTFVAKFDASRIPGADPAESWRRPLERTFTVPAPVAARTTTVRQVYPGGGVVPENMLRFYIEFSAPMGRGEALENMHLLADDGTEVVDPFLPVEADLWNADRTRFTLFFDPGRVKRGIKPNRDMGRALVSGRRYTLIVRDRWLDGLGQPLKEEYRHTFTAGPAEEAALETASWRIAAPAAGTRDPVTVTFPKALDHGLLRRALGITKVGLPDAAPEVRGDAHIEGNETRWVFTPREPWSPGPYALVVLTLLEDPAGNRIGRAFEVRRAESDAKTSAQIPFTVR